MNAGTLECTSLYRPLSESEPFSHSWAGLCLPGSLVGFSVSKGALLI